MFKIKILKSLNRFYLLKNFNAYFVFLLFVISSGYILSYLNLNDQSSKYYVVFLMLVTGIKILSGYAINLIKVSNFRNVLLSNISHFLFQLSLMFFSFYFRTTLLIIIWNFI